jgi:uncharacterized protein YdaU (DUF1376 family)
LRGDQERGEAMNGLPYYKAYPRDFIEGTVGMSFELKAAYRLVLDLIYMQGGNLPDDPRYISGLLGCTIRKWTSLREALIGSGKIYAENGHLGNHRAVIELETLAKLQDKQRENASGPRKNKGLEKPPLNHTEPDTDIEEPSGSLSETSSDAPRKSKGKRAAYPAPFEAVWLAYPTDRNMSKAEGFDAWKRLDEDDRAALATSIPAFKAYCRAHPDYRPIHFCRYVQKRRFDGFAPQGQAAQPDENLWLRRLNHGRSTRNWSTAEWGPRPTEPGCLVPKHLLQPGDGQGWGEWQQRAA